MGKTYKRGNVVVIKPKKSVFFQLSKISTMSDQCDEATKGVLRKIYGNLKFYTEVDQPVFQVYNPADTTLRFKGFEDFIEKHFFTDGERIVDRFSKPPKKTANGSTIVLAEQPCNTELIAASMSFEEVMIQVKRRVDKACRELRNVGSSSRHYIKTVIIKSGEVYKAYACTVYHINRSECKGPRDIAIEEGDREVLFKDSCRLHHFSFTGDHEWLVERFNDFLKEIEVNLPVLEWISLNPSTVLFTNLWIADVMLQRDIVKAFCRHSDLAVSVLNAEYKNTTSFEIRADSFLGNSKPVDRSRLLLKRDIREKLTKKYIENIITQKKRPCEDDDEEHPVPSKKPRSEARNMYRNPHLRVDRSQYMREAQVKDYRSYNGKKMLKDNPTLAQYLFAALYHMKDVPLEELKEWMGCERSKWELVNLFGKEIHAKKYLDILKWAQLSNNTNMDMVFDDMFTRCREGDMSNLIKYRLKGHLEAPEWTNVALEDLAPKNWCADTHVRLVQPRQYLGEYTNSVQVLSGDMGSGKTMANIELIKGAPSGSVIFYLVGRVHLAGEIAQKIRDQVLKCQVITDPQTPVDENSINVCVVVINSLYKFTDQLLRAIALIVDEYETTLSNLWMDKINRKKTTEIIQQLVRQSWLSRFCDAMFTIPKLIGVTGLLLEVEPDKKVHYIKLSNKTRPRTVTCTYNDMKGVREYSKRILKPIPGKNPLFDEELISKAEDGFVERLLYEVICGRPVAVAVPTKMWANKIEAVLRYNDVFNVVKVTGDSRVKDCDIMDICSGKILPDVLIYTSTISAGHSIEVKNHYHSVFVVVPTPNKYGQWCTPNVGEMMQMVGRVRYPATDRIFFTTQPMKSWVQDKLSYKSYTVEAESIFVLTKSGDNMIDCRLAVLSDEEYKLFIERWLCEKAFPGSKRVAPDKDRIESDPWRWVHKFLMMGKTLSERETVWKTRPDLRQHYVDDVNYALKQYNARPCGCKSSLNDEGKHVLDVSYYSTETCETIEEFKRWRSTARPEIEAEDYISLDGIYDAEEEIRLIPNMTPAHFPFEDCNAMDDEESLQEIEDYLDTIVF